MLLIDDHSAPPRPSEPDFQPPTRSTPVTTPPPTAAIDPSTCHSSILKTDVDFGKLLDRQVRNAPQEAGLTYGSADADTAT